jgi:hypothetical protein
MGFKVSKELLLADSTWLLMCKQSIGSVYENELSATKAEAKEA